MLRSIRARLSTLVFCTAVVCAAAVVSAADGNAVSSSRDAGKRTTAGSQWTIVATYAIPEGASGLAWDGTSLYCGRGVGIIVAGPTTGVTARDSGTRSSPPRLAAGSCLELQRRATLETRDTAMT